MRRLVLVVVIWCAVQVPVFGQLDQRGYVGTTTQGLSTANYFYARPNELSIIVSVMGAVQRPGRYEISKSIDLVNLLALAGGENADGSIAKVMLTRREEQGGEILLRKISVDLEKMSKVDSTLLVMQPGDVVYVSRSTWAGFRDVFTFLVGSAIIITAVSQVIIATK
jgi:hypothetical protein